MDLISNCRVLPMHEDITNKLSFTWRNRKYIEIKDDIKIKQRTNLDHHVLRYIANVCHLPGPPFFLLQVPLSFKFRNATLWCNTLLKNVTFYAGVTINFKPM